MEQNNKKQNQEKHQRDSTEIATATITIIYRINLKTIDGIEDGGVEEGGGAYGGGDVEYIGCVIMLVILFEWSAKKNEWISRSSSIS